jgi:hypothetical protein
MPPPGVAPLKFVLSACTSQAIPSVVPLQACLSSAAQAELDWFLLRALNYSGLPIPPTLISRVRDQSAQNCRAVSDLVRIVQCLDAAGIQCLALKGPALGQFLYSNLSARAFTDLDLLMDKAAIRPATQLLENLGYRLASGRLDDPDDKDLLFVSPGSGLAVELHWALHPPTYANPCPDDLWSRSVTVSLAGVPVRSLHPDDLVLYLSIHGTRHLWSKPQWALDLHTLLQSSAVQWPMVLSEARKSGTLRILHLSALVCSLLFATPVPPPLSSSLQRDPFASQLASRIVHTLLDSEPLGNMDSLLFRILSRERFRDRLTVIRRAMRTIWKPGSVDRSLLPLPTFLYFLYFLTRPVRLMRSYGLRWFLAILPLSPWTSLIRTRGAGSPSNP